jgi:hypothetical protein
MPELVVAMLLQWLAGVQWQDIKKVYGLGRSHSYFLRLKFIHAVMVSPLLEITLPNSSDIDALKKLSLQFEAHTSRPVFRGWVGELDGLTALVNAPPAKEADSVVAYYLGHYKHDSLTVQAMSITVTSSSMLPLQIRGVFPIQKHLP